MDILNELISTFDTYTRSFEVLWVKENVKPVARLAMPDNKLDEVGSFCKRHNLSLELSTFKVLMDFSGAYSTKGTRVGADSAMPGYRFCYISKDEQKAKEARYLEFSDEYFEFGRMLGYPSCCCKFFIDHMHQERNNHNDYVVPAFENSKKPFPWQTNIFGRYFDIALLSHAPHSFNCEHSEHMAKKHFEIIEHHSKETAERFEEFLKNIALYKDGKPYILGGSIVKEKVMYSDVISLGMDEFTKLLHKNRVLELTDNGVKVNGHAEKVLVF